MLGIDNLIKDKIYTIQIYSFSNGSFLPASGDNLGQHPVEFAAFITDFSDSFKSEWKQETIFGKMDPIATFKNTARTINISFDIPSESIEAAINNMTNIDYIIRGLYPIYSSGVAGTRTMSSPPMFRVKFGNFISNVVTNNDENTLRTGLLCYMRGFDFKPKVDSGFFIARNMLYPKLLSASMTLEIIHEHPLGNYIKDGIPTPRINIGKFPHLYTKPSDSNATTPAPVDIPTTDTEGAAAGAATAEATGTAPAAPATQKPKPSGRRRGKARPKPSAGVAVVANSSIQYATQTTNNTIDGEVITDVDGKTKLRTADGRIIDILGSSESGYVIDE
jgi:hypothetical protein